MTYTYPEALNALESVLNELSQKLRGAKHVPVRVVADAVSGTASVSWDMWEAVVHLPVRPAATRMTDAEFQDYAAYGWHEIGHPTFTDKAAWEAACLAGLGRLTNAVEDVRMELETINSGVAVNAKAVLSRLVSRKIAEARASGDWNPNARKSIGWTLCVLGRIANGYDIPAADVAWIKAQIKPGSTVAKVLAWALPEMAAATSTADCAAIAAKIQKAIAAPEKPVGEGKSGGEGNGPASDKPAPKGPEGQEEGNEGEGEEGEGEGEGEGQPGEGEGEEGEGEGQPGNGRASRDQDRPEDSEGESKPGGGGVGHGDGSIESDEKPVFDESELTEADLSPTADDEMRGYEADVERRVLDLLRANAKHDGKPDAWLQGQFDKGRAIGAEILKTQAATASKQRALLARALRANETDDCESGRRNGKLDRHSLTRAYAGAQNVFSKRTISEGFETDVCILVDASGSMKGSAIYRAVEAATVVAQAAASVGAPCTVEAFNTSGFIRAGAVGNRRTPEIRDMAKLHGACTSGTPLSAHIARAAMAQHKRAPYKRRVLFIITDGGCDYGSSVVKRTGEYVEQACGTVLAHISIGRHCVGEFKAEVAIVGGKKILDVGLGHFVKVLQAL